MKNVLSYETKYKEIKMKVYLDNNIIISIEENEIKLSDLKNYFGADVEFVYSYIHIQELLEAGLRFEELKVKRLETIRKITKSKLINPHLLDRENEFIFTHQDPELMLGKVQATQFINDKLKSLTSINDKHHGDRLVKALNIDISRLNNYPIDEVINIIDRAFRSNLNIELDMYITLTGLLLHEQICSIVNLLDLIGFWKDKKTSKSNMARLYDASHAYFAAGCQYFVSNDTRCILKTKVAYNILNIGTQIIEWKKIA